jgi:hypothetical protein
VGFQSRPTDKASTRRTHQGQRSCATAPKGRTHDCKRPVLFTKITLASWGPSTHEAASPLRRISRRPLGTPGSRRSLGACWACCADRTRRTGDARITFIALCSRGTWRPWRSGRPLKPIATAQSQRYHQNREQQYFLHNAFLPFPRLRQPTVTRQVFHGLQNSWSAAREASPDQLLDLSLDPRPVRASSGLRAIEFTGDQLAVPGQDGVRRGTLATSPRTLRPSR